ncbi:Subtilase-type proteinase psp3 [Colletotrichum tanaceti]|uniref:Subtilase-type proteinase psp3 n=1 Tax=Colletotrichum tanaceti TaxID=1306861 RepID=A0A4U6X1V1_9PEZI|nr:Subtilase-type proteinase psp3 [Colletotrichum tanaceti]TKW49362.1 Subtilase-type proteinase psp3 [Colletotrichum tanaceti]
MTPFRFLALLVSSTFISACLSRVLTNSTSSTGAFEAKTLIWAKKGTSKEDAEGFHDALVGMVGDENQVESISDGDGVPCLWRAALTTAQIDEVGADRVVDYVGTDQKVLVENPDSATTTDNRQQLQKRAGLSQTPDDGWAPHIVDLRMLSTAPSQPLSDSYRYQEPAGKGITVYIIDSGSFNLEHTQFQTEDPTITRRILSNPIDPKEAERYDEWSNHGTRVASKAVGKTVGVAKLANLVVVRVPREPDVFDVIEAWDAVSEDIKKRNLQGKAVVSTSLHSKALIYDYLLSTRIAEKYRTTLHKIASMDIPIICSAGSYFDDTRPPTWPSHLRTHVPLVVVGAANTDGTLYPFSPGDASTYAVGQALCADFWTIPGGGLAPCVGIAFATPQIAGLAAYFLSQPLLREGGGLRKNSVAADMNALIRVSSYARGASVGHLTYPPVAWNLVKPWCNPWERKHRGEDPVPGQDAPACSPLEHVHDQRSLLRCDFCGYENRLAMGTAKECEADEARRYCEQTSGCQCKSHTTTFLSRVRPCFVSRGQSILGY